MAETIKLDEEDYLLDFEIHGFAFVVDVAEALDLLVEKVDKPHAKDPTGSKAFLNTIIGLLKERWGVPRCGQSAAWQFYKTLTEFGDELKKTTGETPKSGTGSESTPAAGQKPESEPASTTSSDATPSEMCASLI